MIRWGDGLEPRQLVWVVPGKLAACECPGGYGDTRREVRLKEELIWIRKHNFDAVIPLMDDPQLAAAYKNTQIACFELDIKGLPSPKALHEVFGELGKRLDNGQRILIHRYNLDETITAFMGSFLLWYGMVGSAISAEQTIKRMFDRPVSMQTRQSLVEMADWCAAAKSKSQAKVKAKVKAKAAPKAKAKSEAVSKAKPKAKSGSKLKAVPKSGSKAKPKAKSGSKLKAVPKSGSKAK